MKQFMVKPYQRQDGPEMFAVYTRKGKLIAECSTKEAAAALACTLNVEVGSDTKWRSARHSQPAG
jgi:hypothetical protein